MMQSVAPGSAVDRRAAQRSILQLHDADRLRGVEGMLERSAHRGTAHPHVAPGVDHQITRYAGQGREDQVDEAPLAESAHVDQGGSGGRQPLMVPGDDIAPGRGSGERRTRVQRVRRVVSEGLETRPDERVHGSCRR
jgi:hypothetical protein